MTHRKKLTIFLLAVATLFTFVLLIHPYRKNDSSLLSDKLLRFRVLADSDSSIDQYEKNELSKKMITLLSPALSNIKTKEEALTLLRESLPFLNAYCKIMCCPIMAHKITPLVHSVPISFLIKHMETINFQPVYTTHFL